MFSFYLVSKPTSKSFEPPPRPSYPAPQRSSIPPPRPVNPVAAPPSEEATNQASANSNQIPDVAQPEVHLLNMLPRSNNNNNKNTVNNSNIPPKEASFDLLGSFETAEAKGNATMPDLLSESQPKSQGLDDIFAGLSQPYKPPPSNVPDLESMGLDFSATNSASTAKNMNFDPFGNASFVGNDGLLKPDTSPSPSQAKQPPGSTQASGSKDPFADMANLASGLNLNWGSQSSAPAAKPATGSSPQATQFSSPTHQYGGFVPNASQSQQNTTSARSPSDGQSSSKPDYSRSHFDTKSKQNGGASAGNGTNPTGPATSSVGGDIFADILGQQGYNFATKPQAGPRSINEMRKEELIKDMDPDKLKIMEWVRQIIAKEW